MKYAFIGTGSMAAAIIRGMVAGGVAPCDILAFNRTREKADALANELGIVVCDTLEAAAQAGAIVLATTPQSFADILPRVGREQNQQQQSRIESFGCVAYHLSEPKIAIKKGCPTCHIGNPLSFIRLVKLLHNSFHLRKHLLHIFIFRRDLSSFFQIV